MKTRLLAAVLMIVTAPVALADEQAAAEAQCVAVTGTIVLEGGNVPPDQAGAVKSMISTMCDCMTTRVAALGDDGQKVLRVIAKTTVDDARKGAADTTADRAHAVRILSEEFEMSDVEAGAFYDRINPQVEAIAAQCGQEAAAAAQP